MTRLPTALLVLAAAALLAGCQSDGTIGRDDSYRNTVWREQVRREQYRRDLRNTSEAIRSWPQSVADSFIEFPKRIGLLRHLYVDGVGERWFYREKMAEASRTE